MQRILFSARIIPIVVLAMVLGAIALSPRPQSQDPQSQGPPYTQRDQPLDLEHTWIISAAEAKQFIEQGATLLDARKPRWGLKQIPGSVSVQWQDFSPQPQTNKGNLIQNDTVLGQKLRKLRISPDRPVLVFGNPPRGWGEEGRIVWMLRTLGHRQAALVDGGYDALAQEMLPPAKPQLRKFVIQRNPTWHIQRDALKNLLQQDLLQQSEVIIDTRTPEEYAGATPHGEQRRGHIPGAISLHFRDLLTPQGTLLPQAQVVAKLQALGITQDQEIVAYCTGGIRSGWLTVVLADLGFSVKNYAGSMWEWSAGSPQDYPLVIQP